MSLNVQSPNSRANADSILREQKRFQTTLGLSHVRTPITVLADDHVFWPPKYLSHLLAPFHNPSIGGVGTSKRVRPTYPPGTFTWLSFWNLMGILYLERHNFDICATNALDGGVFVLSGRTAAYRTSIFTDPGLRDIFWGNMRGSGELGQ